MPRRVGAKPTNTQKQTNKNNRPCSLHLLPYYHIAYVLLRLGSLLPLASLLLLPLMLQAFQPSANLHIAEPLPTNDDYLITRPSIPMQKLTEPIYNRPAVLHLSCTCPAHALQKSIMAITACSSQRLAHCGYSDRRSSSAN